MTLQLFFAALLALLSGLAFCFWGYRVFMVMLPVWGFLGGFWLGADFFSLIFGDGFLATTTGWVVGLIVGLIGAILSYAFYAMGILFVAAVLGAGLGSGIMQAFGIGSNVLILSVAIIAAVVAAFLAWRYNLQRYVIIGLTAVLGADLITLAPLLLLGRVPLEEVRAEGSALIPVLGEGYLWIAIFLVLAVAGFIFQARRNPAFFDFGKEDYVQGWS